jgi:hypothetical protein
MQYSKEEPFLHLNCSPERNQMLLLISVDILSKQLLMGTGMIPSKSSFQDINQEVTSPKSHGSEAENGIHR